MTLGTGTRGIRRERTVGFSSTLPKLILHGYLLLFASGGSSYRVGRDWGWYCGWKHVDLFEYMHNPGVRLMSTCETSFSS